MKHLDAVKHQLQNIRTECKAKPVDFNCGQIWRVFFGNPFGANLYGKQPVDWKRVGSR